MTAPLVSLQEGDHDTFSSILLAHDLVRKPVPTPDHIEGKLFGIMR
jgi:hypothetical protein